MINQQSAIDNQQSLRHSPRTHKPRCPVRGTEPLDPYFASRARRVDEFIAADGNPHVSGGLPHRAVDRVEEHEITGAKIGRVDFSAGPELLRDSTGHADTILIEDIPDEAAAIESGRIVAAIPVRRAAQLQRRT